MSRIAAVICFLAPLALAPHLLFYYDVTPKIAILFAGAALVFILSAFDLDSLRSFYGTAGGKAFSISVLALVAVTALSALLAAHPSLAWNGSNWRRFGGMTQGVCLLSTLMLAASTRGREERILPVFRAICGAGILAALYGIAQYFGWDPILAAATYEAGEGPFRIVRPPSTLGHSDYFAAFLLWPVFIGLAVGRMDLRWRWLGWTSALTGAIAILLSGSRGALLGLGVGGVLYLWSARTRLRVWGAAAALAVIALSAFYISPAGERLRARAHWIGEDPAGGARLLLWRDTLRMASTRPWSGFGPENFVAEFPKFESVELARLYPDFYHESPHNLWLDTLAGQGFPGLLAQLALVFFAISTGVRALQVKPEMAAGLLAGLIAALVAHQFAVFTVVNALYLYLGCALLVVVGQDGILQPVGNRLGSVSTREEADYQSAAGFYPARLFLSAALALFLLFMTYRFVSTDLALASAERGIAAGNTQAAAAAYRQAVDLRASGVTADLYFSRRWARAAANAPDALSKLYLAQLAAGSGSLATEVPEGGPNAWFNVAELSASRNDPASVETALRSAIAQSPNWFKPHWALARLLFLQGRKDEARQESVKAMDLNQRDAEVASTLAPILSFRGSLGQSPNP